MPQEPKNKEFENRKLKKNFDHSKLSEAFANGELTCPVGTELILSRYRNGKDVLTIGTVKSVQDNGLVHVWDECVQQWFIFSKQEPPKVAKIYKP
jgi:hypothetical protein